MAIARALAGRLREVWNEATATDFNGGATIAVTTAIPIPRTTDLSRCWARLKMNTVTGLPVVANPVLTRVNGLLMVTFSNAAVAGNMATYTLECGIEYSTNQARDATYNGFSQVLWANGGSSVAPTSNPYRIYVDGSNGSDNASGGVWGVWPAGGLALRSIGAAMLKVQQVISANPTATDIELWIRGVFAAGDVLAYAPLQGRTRIHLIHPVSEWTTVGTDTLADWTGGAGTIPLRTTTDRRFGIHTAGGAGIVFTNDHNGMFVRLTDTVNGTSFVTQILRVDPRAGAANRAWLALDSTAVPAAYRAVTTTVDLLCPGQGAAPHIQIQGEIDVRSDSTATGTLNGVLSTGPLSWVFGLRADRINLSGNNIGAVGCYARTLDPGGTLGFMSVSSTGLVATGFMRDATIPFMTDAQAASWGLVNAAVNIFNGYCIGSFANSLLVSNATGWTTLTAGPGVTISRLYGYFGPIGLEAASAVGSLVNANCTIGEGFYADSLRIGSSALVLAEGGFLLGWGGVLTTQNATFNYGTGAKNLGFTAICDGGVAADALLNAAGGGTIIGGNCPIQTIDFAGVPTYPLYALYAHEGGRIRLLHAPEDGAGVECFGTSSQIRSELDGWVYIEGAYTLTAARAGAAADFVATNGGKIDFGGSVTKTALNTIPSPVIFCQNDGTINMTNAASVLSVADPVVGAAPGDWGSSYGANGAIFVDQGSKFIGAVLTHPTPGTAFTAAVGPAVNIRHGSQLYYAAGSAFGGAAITTTVVGGNAAATWAAAGLNDLAAAGACELCLRCVRV